MASMTCGLTKFSDAMSSMPRSWRARSCWMSSKMVLSRFIFYYTSFTSLMFCSWLQ